MSKITIKKVKETEIEVIFRAVHKFRPDMAIVHQFKLFKESPEGLEAFRSNLTLDDLVTVNRQKLADIKNNLRRYNWSGAVNTNLVLASLSKLIDTKKD